MSVELHVRPHQPRDGIREGETVLVHEASEGGLERLQLLLEFEREVEQVGNNGAERDSRGCRAGFQLPAEG